MKALAIIALLLATVLASGAEHSHEDAAGRFYESWMRPDMRNVSCCNKKDCYATEAKQVGQFWFARIRETGQFVRVPTEKIETDRDSPDGRNHLCASPTGTVFCFSIGGGT